ARQNQSPAACAPSGAYVQHFTLATIPASNARMFGWEGGMCKPFALTAARVPKHMSSVPRNGGGGASPMPEGRGLRAARKVSPGHVRRAVHDGGAANAPRPLRNRQTHHLDR